MKTSNKQTLELARTELEFHSAVLKANEKVWQQEWEAAENPFEAVAQYKKNRPKRKPIIEAWLTAKHYYESLPKPRVNI